MANVILLVEDNEDHAEMIRAFLGEHEVDKQVHWVKDGQEAIDFVHRQGRHAEAPRPALIILDLNLPKASGFEVLKNIKEDPALKVIPVVMLTTSDRQEEMLKCYRLGVNSFITKPVRFDDYLEKLQSLNRYWFATNRGPHHETA
ncbi:MAG TPA: response regulator [Pseudodesulfovibrio sp.]|nr:response regulator [Pseudodesulfovibrio sp.]